MPITPTEKIWMDGELVDWDKATVHVLTHSLHYGLGVFEGIRAYATANGPAVFRLREHTRRLFKGARILQMDLPYTEDEIFEAIKLTVRVNGLETCYIRPIAYLGYGEMGLNPIPCSVRVAIAVLAVGLLPRRRGHRARHPPQGQLLGAPRPSLDADGRQGDRHVRELVARQDGSCACGLRRGDHVHDWRGALRGDGRERLRRA